MRCKKPLSIILSGLLAITLCPAIAYAAPSSLGTADAALQPQATTLTPQATTTIYLPTKATVKTLRSDGTSTTFSTSTYKYSKRGLLTSRTTKSGGSKSTFTWLYKGSNIQTVKTKNTKLVFKLNSKGKKTSGTWKMTGGSADKVVETYTYSGSRIKTCRSTTYWTDMMTRKKKHNSTTHSYTYKNGLPVKVASKSGSYKWKSTYAYDTHKNLQKQAYSGTTTKYTNTYDENGLLKKHTEIAKYEGDDVTSTTYSYKPVKVKSSLAAKVKAQRWAILNNNLNYAIGGQVMS